MRTKLITLLGITVLLIIAICFVAVGYKGTQGSGTALERVGDGNLKVVTIDKNKLLVNESQDLTLYTGDRTRDFRSSAAYAAAGASHSYTYKKVQSELIALETNARQTEVNCLMVNNNVVSCDEGTRMSPDYTKLLIDLGDGIWIIDASGNKLRNVADNMPAQNERIEDGEHRTEGTGTDNEENKYVLLWTLNPRWVNNHVIAFSSNRDVYPSGMASSIWTMDIATKEVTKRIDATASNDELNVLYADDSHIIAWGGMTRNVYRYEFEHGTVETYTIQGVPFSVSNNGQLVLYHSLDETSTMRSDISILNLANGSISTADHLDDHQIGNGAWDEGNRYYVFFSHSIKEVGAQLYVLDVDRSAIQLLDTPDDIGILDPNGSITWLDKHNVIMAAEQGSWKVPVDKMLNR